MRLWSAVVVCVLASAPLVWGACTEPPAPVSPSAPGGTGSAAAGTGALDTGPAPGSPLAASACGALIEPLAKALEAARSKASACNADTDCEVIFDNTCMTVGCGNAIATREKAAYLAEHKRISEPPCAAWDSGGCRTTYPLPMPSCAVLKPVCNAGHCDAKW